MNRVALAALNGSETAMRTMENYEPVVQVSMTSSVKGSGNRPPQTLKEKLTGAKSHD